MGRKPIDQEARQKVVSEIYPLVKRELESKLNPIYRDGDLRITEEKFPSHIAITFVNANRCDDPLFIKKLPHLLKIIGDFADQHQVNAVRGYYRIGQHGKGEFVYDLPYYYALKPRSHRTKKG